MDTFLVPRVSADGTYDSQFVNQTRNRTFSQLLLMNTLLIVACHLRVDNKCVDLAARKKKRGKKDVVVHRDKI